METDNPEGANLPPHSAADPSLRSSIPPEPVEAHEDDKPTDSHQLADAAVTEPQAADSDTGVAQIEHGETEVRDLGWKETPERVPSPLVTGLSNEELWMLVRRFNKQIFNVRAIDAPPLAGLDLNIADDEEFSPDKLRAHLERFYMTVVVGLFALWKHVARIRSWRERDRTLAFLAVYAAAWLLDYLVPVLLAFVMVLVLFPAARSFCFPPAPPALIDSKTGGVKTPAAGVLGSDDSVTGAPEKHAGEAVEQEAHSFVGSISSLVVSTAAGKNPQNEPDDNPAIPDPTHVAGAVTQAKDKSSGDEATAHHDKTKKPVSDTVWEKAKPAMQTLAMVVDTWERFGNALSPTPPFPAWRPRLVLVAPLVPLFLASFFVTSYMVMKGTGFAIGFGLFGDPLIQRGIQFMNRVYPHLKKYLELRHTLLRGVPTNAQLTLTLLRIGERNKAPLPPPPVGGETPPVAAHDGAHEHIENLGNASEEEVAEAIHPDEETLQADREEAAKAESDKKGKHKSKLLSFLKGGTKGGMQTALGADRVRAAVGARAAKDRLGVVRQPGTNPAEGPVRFPARYHGKKGEAYITAAATSPAISWTTSIDSLDPAWTVALADVVEIRKVGGLGWKSKVLVGWSMEKEVADGIVLKDRSGREYHLTAMPMRDQFFNRIVAMGQKLWEAF